MAFKFVEDDFNDEDRKQTASHDFVQTCGHVKQFFESIKKAGAQKDKFTDEMI